MPRSDSRALVRNGIARLWWTAFLTYDSTRDNPYELTGVLLSTLDITQQILERNMAERVLPQSAVELRYAESAPEGATLEEKEPSSFFGRPVGAGGVGRQEVADPARIELWASRGAAGRASDRGTS